MKSPGREPVSLVIVGLGGYGAVYLEDLLDRVGAPPFRITGAVDPRPERCPYLDRLDALGAPRFESLEAFFDGGGAADLAVISSPIAFHMPQARLALEQGSHVLLEKPVAARLDEVDDLIRARDRAGRFVAVGYQWSYSEGIMRLKADLLAGRLGRPLRAKALCPLAPGCGLLRAQPVGGEASRSRGAMGAGQPGEQRHGPLSP